MQAHGEAEKAARAAVAALHAQLRPLQDQLQSAKSEVGVGWGWMLLQLLVRFLTAYNRISGGGRLRCESILEADTSPTHAKNA